MVGKVRILPELALEDPGLSSKLSSLDKFRVPPPNWTQETKPCPSSYLPRRSHKVKRNIYVVSNK